MRYLGTVSCLGAFLMAAGNQKAGSAPDERGFNWSGRGKSNLSQEEMARSAGRAEHLRALPADRGIIHQQPPLVASVSPSAMGVSPQESRGFIAPPPIPESDFHSPPSPRRVDPPPSPPRGIEPAIDPGEGEPRPGRGISRSGGGSPLDELRQRAEALARQGLRYKFGGDDPSDGGMDCSATMRYLFGQMGYSDMPRTSYQQFEWIKSRGKLKKVGFFYSKKKAIKNLKPGDLLFSGGTYNSGHRVSHVMMYMGQSRSGQHYVFGARGTKNEGINGSGVDIFEFNPRYTKLVGCGRLPGFGK